MLPGTGYLLLAEDDDGVRAVATRILERGGYRVKSVASGNAACLAAASETFDLVLLDVVMPGLSCRETVQRIRELRPDTLILLSSGYTAGEAVTQLMEQTGLGLLRKPYDPDQLLHTVGAALGKPAR